MPKYIYKIIKVPSTHPPKYTVHPGVTLVPINGIASLDKCWEKYVVLGDIYKSAYFCQKVKPIEKYFLVQVQARLG